MKCQCEKCGHINTIPNGCGDPSYESVMCGSCMSVFFIPNTGLYSYMARTKMNEAKAYEDLYNNKTFMFYQD